MYRYSIKAYFLSGFLKTDKKKVTACGDRTRDIVVSYGLRQLKATRSTS